LQDTIRYHPQGENDRPEEVLRFVYQALKEKGYNPVHQLVGYLLSGDTSYIPRHNQARTIIRKVERDELLEELVRAYFEARD
jgi:uncharacterized protein (UPF0297 family)